MKETSLGPTLWIRLNEEERPEYCYEEYEVRLDHLARPVYIRDEGDFLTVWGRYGRIDMPVRFLAPLRLFLRRYGVAFEDEFERGKERDAAWPGFVDWQRQGQAQPLT